MLSLLGSPPLARAQMAPPDDAKKLYEDGLSLYALGRYEEAAPKFERAFELKHLPALLYNAAQAHRLAGHSARAITLYQSYLQLYGDPEHKAEIEARIIDLKSKLAAEKSATPGTAPPGTAPPGAAPPPPETTPPGAPAPTLTPAPSPPPPSSAESTTLTATAPPIKKPLIKRPWFWAAVGGGAVVVAGVIIGIAVGTRGHTSPPASFGTVNGN